MDKIKYKKQEYNIYNIRYIFKNRRVGSNKILFKGELSKLKRIISSQLNGCNRAKFKVLLDDGKVAPGWLLKIDLLSYEIS
ncbi:MAG: hypothetical protein HFF36_11470 [Coprobacillus sp.]|jgi:hypothetical protein|uniref:hypothetical protein n=1 Tax=uncultured Clostridium sp. TaxID=59620 RepID=UPI00216D6FA7|nr:hypothetical protein [uncultured Clostridium sp.]MCI9094384.1 hypothetical protein [Coprobacillus sp.]